MQDGSRNFSQAKKQGTTLPPRKKRNDPCPRFSSADKGHFWSLLVSNIIFGYLHFCFYLLLSTREPVKSCLLFFFSNESTVGFAMLLVGVSQKASGSVTLIFRTTHRLSSLGSDSILSSCFRVQIPLCSACLTFKVGSFTLPLDCTSSVVTIV